MGEKFKVKRKCINCKKIFESSYCGRKNCFACSPKTKIKNGKRFKVV